MLLTTHYPLHYSLLNLTSLLLLYLLRTAHYSQLTTNYYCLQATPSQMEQLGLLPNKKTVLVVGGGDGVGSRPQIEPPPCTLTAACNRSVQPRATQPAGARWDRDRAHSLTHYTLTYSLLTLYLPASLRLLTLSTYLLTSRKPLEDHTD